MHSAYNAYPEFLCMDATYKLLEIRLPVYILLCEDGAGESEIAAVGLLTHEDAASLSWFVERFKSFNIAWPKTNVFMTDKDLTEREILRSAFPGVSLLLCLFHTMRTFNREITTSKLGITSGERTSSLELIQKLAYATSEEVYDELYRLFISSSPTTVVDYFNKNWHNIRVDWVLGLNFASGNFMNSTNNRLENFNGKLKEVIDCNSSLENFLDKFYVVLASMRNERDHKTIFQMQKVLVDMFDPNSAEAAYKKVLTLYAAQHVLKQMSLRGDINLLQRENEYFMVNTTEGLHTVTWNFCSCMFRKSMHLPCRHIFAARQFLRLNLFDIDLCAERWTLKYYRQHQRAFNSPIMADELRSVEFHVAPKKKLLSQHEKFKLALQETSFLATLVSETTGQTFEQRLSLLQSLKKGWTDGKVMLVNELIDVDICSSKTESTLPSALTIVTESPINSLGCVSGVNGVNTSVAPLVVSDKNVLSTKKNVSQLTTEYAIDNDSILLEEAIISEKPQHEELTSVKNYAESHLNRIRVPKHVSRCGRPKGSTLTTIGLPKKRQPNLYEKRVPFLKLHPSKRHAMMLGWFLKPDDVHKALSGVLIESNCIEKRVNHISSAILDESAGGALLSLQGYFTPDGWKVLHELIDTKSRQKVWPCAVCQKSTCLGNDIGDSVGCDSCLLWFHKKCVGQKEGNLLKSKYWFCHSC
ncbi:zinc finger SWIM domain-containing protein 1-like [Hydra vulgaris]|uniref:zinc finger SWIM domain-containing protein 1-like n=1 Tax=Hydra vulgaris TaxID=6087 RepID=UPI0032E9C723